MMLQAFAISLADKALAAYCSQQPMPPSLQRIKGATLAIECSDAPIAILIEVGERLRLLPLQEQTADCRIDGTLAALQQLKHSERLPELLKTEAVSVTGDVKIASQIGEALSHTQFDSEEWLSQRIGDVPAHLLVTAGKRVQHWAAHRKQTMEADVEAYLQDEIRWLPAAAELRQFSRQVNELNARCQQLSERIEKLTS
ncbi:SCP2 sterol-binding domain-containing protein [Neiella sp. HB171785]|uniref:SCP2 sterol-binding domain-containing protein n=1 Tax=Neiella litorisoli TaxID=2771431 RepID=A0A8J6UDJ9_9GAMM|nr:SCP2 sterol-binding domain-containing protein [Neiella litorisoli]MBD1388019.1 SCP2 sterol-binding domain-containing protein [Neiella litorisoli]